MYEKAIEILNIFDSNGYVAYIVGGFPRDTLLGLKTMDIDICTNAKPKEIIELFSSSSVSDVGYGSVKLIYKNSKFDVTTFRKDIKYEDNRRPVKMKYINNLKGDLLRRDFTINTICIDKDEKYIDILNGKEDINNKIIKTVGNPKYRIKEDALRILRAIRFASILGFDIDKNTGNYLMKYGYLLKNLSNERKKEELSKIFSSHYKEKGRELILKFKLDKYLGLNNLKSIVMCDDIIGIWTQLNMDEVYNFTKLEKEQMKNIRELLNLELNNYNIYKYGLYISTVASEIKGYNKKVINKMYNDLPILSSKDIVVKPMDIADILKRKPGSYLKEIMSKVEEEIVNKNLENNYEKIEKYIIDNYN